MTDTKQYKCNAAQRLHDVLAVAAKGKQQEKVAEVWAKAFGIQHESDTARYLEITESLRLLHNQHEVVKSAMEGSEYPEELWRFAFNRIDRVLQVDNLSAQWRQHINYLGNDTLVALNWCAAVLQDECTELHEETREDIEDRLNELKESVSGDELPHGLRTFINHQIEIIEKALRQSHIVGKRALRDALYAGYSDSRDQEAVIMANADEPHLKHLATVWKRVKEIPGVLTNTNQALEAGGGLAEKGRKALEYFDTFLS